VERIGRNHCDRAKALCFVSVSVEFRPQYLLALPHVPKITEPANKAMQPMTASVGFSCFQSSFHGSHG
jgi:hypothetical protein